MRTGGPFFKKGVGAVKPRPKVRVTAGRFLEMRYFEILNIKSFNKWQKV